MEITSFSIAINMMSTELGGIVCNKDDKQVKTVLMSYTLKPRASQYPQLNIQNRCNQSALLSLVILFSILSNS